MLSACTRAHTHTLIEICIFQWLNYKLVNNLKKKCTVFIPPFAVYFVSLSIVFMPEIDTSLGRNIQLIRLKIRIYCNCMLRTCQCMCGTYFFGSNCLFWISNDLCNLWLVFQYTGIQSGNALRQCLFLEQYTEILAILSCYLKWFCGFQRKIQRGRKGE